MPPPNSPRDLPPGLLSPNLAAFGNGRSVWAHDSQGRWANGKLTRLLRSRAGTGRYWVIRAPGASYVRNGRAYDVANPGAKDVEDFDTPEEMYNTPVTGLRARALSDCGVQMDESLLRQMTKKSA